MNKKQKLISAALMLTCAAVFIVPVVALVLKWDDGVISHGKPQNPPGKPRVQVELRDEKSGEHYRKRMYADDGKRLVEVEVAYRDGGSGHQYFRNDGTLRNEEHHWGNGNPKKRLEYAADGRTVVRGETFRQDGTKQDSIARLADGSREESKFHTDGTTVVSRQVTDTSGKVVLRETFRENGTAQLREAILADGNKEETTWFDDGKQIQRRRIVDRWGYTVYLDEEFRADGTTISKVERLTNGTTETRKYYPTGNLEMHSVKPSYGDETITYYRADGKTVAKKFTTSYSTAEGWFYRPDGTLEHHRSYGYYGMDVEVYRPDGTVAYRQHWKRVSGSYYYDPVKHEIDTVEICDDKGNLLKRQTFKDEGKTVVHSEDFDSEGKTTAERTYRHDGTLEKEVKYDAEGKVAETIEKKSEDNIRESIDSEHIKQLEYDDPRRR